MEMRRANWIEPRGRQAGGPRRPGAELFGRAWRVARAAEWWGYKIAPALALFYGTALIEGAPLLPLAPAAGLLVAALAICAAYVSVLNDVTDERDDRRAGKPNNMAGKAGWTKAAILGGLVAAGLAVGWAWSADPPLLLAYGGSWIAYSLYSLPPVRLKRRGLAGAIADAAGAHLFPALTAVLLAVHHGGGTIRLPWICAAAIWAVACGLRGIVWHQLKDKANDRAAGVGTLARKVPRRRLVTIGERLIFPIEIAALAALLWQARSPIAAAFLAAYLLFVLHRTRRAGSAFVIVEPRPGGLHLLLDYYAMLLPAAFLIQSAIAWPGDLALLAAHLLLFRQALLLLARQARRARSGWSAR